MRVQIRKFINTAFPMIITYSTFLFVDLDSILKNLKIFNIQFNMVEIFITLLVGFCSYLLFKINCIEKKLKVAILSTKHIVNSRITMNRIEPIDLNGTMNHINSILEKEKKDISDFILEKFPEMSKMEIDDIIKDYHSEVISKLKYPYI